MVGESALSWLRQFVVQESSVLGELSPVGWRELHDVGVRLGEWLNGTLLHAVLGGGQTLRFSSTYKERAIDSRNALMGQCIAYAYWECSSVRVCFVAEGLFAALGDELTSQYSISEPTQCDPNGNPIPEFNLLRFFDTWAPPAVLRAACHVTVLVSPLSAVC